MVPTLEGSRKKSARKKEAVIRARVDLSVKEEAEEILEAVGLSPSEAVRLFLKQVTLHRGLPFDLRIPNEETVEALRAAERGEGEVYTDAKELMSKYRKRP